MVSQPMRARILTTAAMLVLLMAAAAGAATSSANIEVTVRVVPNCRIAVTNLAFGDYDPLVEHAARNLDGTALVRVTCSKNERASIVMEENESLPRMLRAGSEELAYAIFSDPSRTRMWGTGGNAVQVSFEETTAPQELTVYGRIPGGQVVPAGWYSDSVTATVDF